MTDHPDISSQYQISSETLDDLNKFRAQNPLLVPPMPTNRRSSSPIVPFKISSAPCHFQETGKITKLDSSRLHIPSTTSAREHASLPQQSFVVHTPGVASKPYIAPYTPRFNREPLEYITRDMVFDRIYLLLRDNLLEWWTKPHDALGHLTCKIPACCLIFQIPNMKR